MTIISIHAPRKGVRPQLLLVTSIVPLFQSTHPARGCDCFRRSQARHSSDFNPRTPQGGATAKNGDRLLRHADFNPRTPQGGATGAPAFCGQPAQFQSTHPARGCDLPESELLYYDENFNPRTPQGGATAVSLRMTYVDYAFQSTHPARGCDSLACGTAVVDSDFNPRTPQGGATNRPPAGSVPWCISIHAPRKGVRLR